MNKTARLVVSLLAVSLILCGCARFDGTYYYDHAVFAGFDPALLAGEQPLPVTVDFSEGTTAPEPVTPTTPGGDLPDAAPRFATVTVLADQLNIYAEPDPASEQVAALTCGDVIEMSTEWQQNDFRLVRLDGVIAGYAPDGYVMEGECGLYGELPVEYGMARTEAGDYVPASSHLVDVTRYTDEVIVKMQLATNDTSIGEPFYNRNLCMLQYDTMLKLLDAIEMFKKDGYTIKIYDAYRPTSVQQRWFDIIGVHKWVADPSIGMGGRHDRGCAIDMTLVDAAGNELVMPTPMHTFTDAASRWAPMSDEARKNVDYMTKVMVACGFDYINSEWWHFQDTDIIHYLPTDHPIDEIPLVAAGKQG